MSATFTQRAWRALSGVVAPSGAVTEFQWDNHKVLVRRIEGGACEWKHADGDGWRNALKFVKNENIDAAFRHALRRACLKLGVRL